MIVQDTHIGPLHAQKYILGAFFLVTNIHFKLILTRVIVSNNGVLLESVEYVDVIEEFGSNTWHECPWMHMHMLDFDHQCQV